LTHFNLIRFSHLNGVYIYMYMLYVYLLHCRS
jgi:hypothetical protein